MTRPANTPRTARTPQGEGGVRAPLFQLVAVPLLTRAGLRAVADRNRWELERMRRREAKRP